MNNPTIFFSSQEVASHIIATIQTENPTLKLPVNYIQILCTSIDEIPIDGVFDFFDGTMRFHKNKDTTFTPLPSSEESPTLEEPIKPKRELRKKYTPKVYGKVPSNLKRIELKPLSNQYLVSAIIGEITKKFPKEQCYEPHNIAKAIINSIALSEDALAYKTTTNKLIFSLNDIIYITECYDKTFIFANTESEEIALSDTEIIDMIMEEPSTRTILTVDTLPEEYLFDLV